MGGKSTSTTAPKINQLAVQSSSLGLPITLGWGRGRIKANIIWYNGFKAMPHTTKQSGGKGMGGGSKSTTFSYSASIIMGLCEGPVQGVRTVYRDKDVYADHVVPLTWDGFTYGTTTETALQQAGLSLATGSSSQAPWGYVTSLYPAQALGYSGVAYVYAQDYALTDNASLSNHSFEVDFGVQLAGMADADPADIVSDFLTNAAHGVPGWASGLLGDLSDWSLYARANNLLLSPTLEEQRTASDCITEWTDATNSAAFWSEGVLKIATFGDAAATGNGVTWTPNLSPEYDLTEDDFIAADGGPVQLEIVDQSDAYNVVQVEFLDRANQYGVGIALADDNANITEFRERKKDPTQYHCICDADIARHSAQLLLQRTLYRRDLYKFRLPWNFVRLEPMDYVTLTTTSDELQLYRQLVQIVDIEEDEEGVLAFSAEGIDVGTASAALYNAHSGSAVTVNTSVAPGSIATPILINAPAALTGLDPEVWVAVSSPSAAWGGCEVWASADNVHFQKVGRISGPSRVGVSTAGLADHVDPDTTNMLSVDLTASGKTLDSSTAANADAGATLIWLAGELMTYQTATLTSAFHYDLTTLRRGLYGTAHATHGAGAPFARLDDAVFKFPYTSLNVGSTIYLKFPSFNIFGAALEDMSTVTAYNLALLDSAHVTDWRVIADAGVAAAADAVVDAAAAQADANAALADLADIASDSLLTPDEKPRVIYDRDVIIAEQSGIDTQAASFGITTEKTGYDNAVAALSSYLAALTTPVPWSNLSGNTAIVGATFRSKFSDVYSARQTLLNRIAAVAKAQADQGVTDAATAQAAANAAQLTANGAAASASTALGEIGTIVADNVLDRSEKPAVTADWNVLYAEQGGIDAQATAYSITTEKITYDSAISNLASYLLSLSPTWNDFTVDTPITRSTFISKFQDAYTARTALLNKIAAVAGTLASWAGVSGSGKPADNATVGADWSSNLASRPTELTDGRVSAGLDSGGNVNNDKVSTPALQDFSVTNSNQAYNASTIYGAGAFYYQTIVSFDVTMAHDGDIILMLACKQSYHGSTPSWDGHITIDGTQVFSSGGSATSDSVVMSGRLAVSAGTRTVSFEWSASSSGISIDAGNASLVAFVRYK
ncbi:Putative phage tail protein [Sphingomonas sp. YR710]|uniref:phage tail protein n=1 Tax=Sphingomonas sp. YR710 TaxID=1882773 RepID=UPI0008920BA7|nr:phage tail protein [Sphingomonas sp. YR710]SDC49689.1 Putative phage tail protein [Sphingomonas sp. YR710]